MQLHTSDIRMTYEYIRGFTDDIRVHRSDIRMTYEHIRVTYAWHTSTCKLHTDDMRFKRS